MVIFVLMKITSHRFLILIITFFVIILNLNAQCLITSSSGYSVEVYINPVSLSVPSSCEFGYNYNVNLDYTVVYIGTPPPGLYVLQGTLQCGTDNLFFNLPNTSGSGSTITVSNPYNTNSDCNTATVQSLGCSGSSIEISGPGLSHTFVTCAPASLPVELLFFDANLDDESNILLNWETISELNNDFFTIESSTDAKNWNSIGEVDGVGNSSTSINYSFVDRKPNRDISYYRLKQTDFDGESSYSAIVVIELEKIDHLSIYPNPSETTITISGENIENYSILDLLGQNVSSLTNVIEKGNNELVIDISNLKQGNYILVSNNSNAKFTKI